MEKLEIPKAEAQPSGGLAAKLRLAASSLALAATVATVLAQVVEHFRKPKAGSHERTEAGTALLGLSLLKTLPGLIRSARTLSAEFKEPK